MHGTRLRGDVSFSNRAIVCTVLSRHSYMQSSLTPLTDSLGPAMHGHEMKASAPSKTPQCGLDSLYEVLFREQQATTQQFMQHGLFKHGCNRLYWHGVCMRTGIFSKW